MARKALKKIKEDRSRSAKVESTGEHESRIPTSGRKNENASKPVSLAPLAFEDAMRGLLAVRPQRPK
jgi:hypothetical protein